MDNPMIDWFKDCVQKLYQQDPTQGEKEQSSLLESIFDKNVNLLHNHKPMSLSEYMNSLSQSSFATAKTDLEWNVILSQEDEGEAQGSIVAGHFVVTRYMKFRIRAAPAERLQHCFFSAKIRKDAPSEGGAPYTVTEMFITSVFKQAPIHIANIPTS
ncbi:hypothetical protein Agabi119p4_2255 [Agaricus bisporus var. burnettii]|uniref:Uncharacterized protein n=1 Tax=Agaricus bisporus var. burnettii TaxID=192524 RepID=A0A8H7KJS9_AGABI|nr:hypothetical protein Agabi119p4_2255 [Agaricus bisporus var. burnettii]